MKILAITQARLSSTRLPRKILKRLGSGTVLDLHLQRVKKSKKITHFALASAFEDQSFLIEEIAINNGFEFFQGNLDDVLDRFYQLSLKHKPDYIVRITSDCPLIDPKYVDDLIDKFLCNKVDYASNCLVPNLPDGMDAEVFTFQALERAWLEAKKLSEREHVTPYIKNSGNFKIYSVDYGLHLENLRLTLDTEEDYELLNKLVEDCGSQCDLIEYVDYLNNHPELIAINSNNKRDEGYEKSLKGDLKC